MVLHRREHHSTILAVAGASDMTFHFTRFFFKITGSVLHVAKNVTEKGGSA